MTDKPHCDHENDGDEEHVCGGYDLFDMFNAIEELEGEEILFDLGLTQKSPTVPDAWRWTEKGARLSILMILKIMETVSDRLAKAGDEGEEMREQWIEFVLTMLTTYLKAVTGMGYLKEPARLAIHRLTEKQKDVEVIGWVQLS